MNNDTTNNYETDNTDDHRKIKGQSHKERERHDTQYEMHWNQRD